MSAAVLDARGLVKRYGDIVALQDLSLRLGRGEFCALLGPNGAGKSTLFQLLSGLFVPDAGTILIDGVDLRRDAPAALARLGIVFQQSTLDLDLSVRGNLRFHARLHGLGRSAGARIDAALAEAGLVDVADRACRTLSGGNRRKVELARALLHAPKLLLMDEATVGLDPAARATLLAAVHRRCREDGLAVLWATHLVEEALDAQRVLVLHRGRRLAEDTPAGLVAAHGGASLAETFLHLTQAQGARA